MKNLSAVANWFLIYFLMRLALGAATIVRFSGGPVDEAILNLTRRLPELIGPGLVVSAAAAVVFYVLKECCGKSGKG